MVNPFELIDKFPPKRTVGKKIGTVVFIGVIVAILGLAGYGLYCLLT